MRKPSVPALRSPVPEMGAVNVTGALWVAAL